MDCCIIVVLLLMFVITFHSVGHTTGSMGTNKHPANSTAKGQQHRINRSHAEAHLYWCQLINTALQRRDGSFLSKGFPLFDIKCFSTPGMSSAVQDVKRPQAGTFWSRFFTRQRSVRSVRGSVESQMCFLAAHVRQAPVTSV
ncbi:hypothetical protein FQA47_002908 [Oryzias melastigma]|uniref:Secreted protein n=1 Tax=Oryzias melastigma TaxID=30732 RepID=A0A834F4F9_ORYME|nr:hypothetical protein FQA47_002908 [Oryzias melastigma]